MEKLIPPCAYPPPSVHPAPAIADGLHSLSALRSSDDDDADERPGRRCVFCVDRDIDRDESLDRHVRSNHKASLSE